MLVELVHVQAEDALRLDGVVIPATRPATTSCNIDCMLCLHGTGSSFYASAFFNGLTPHLIGAGLPMTRVNMRGHDLIATSAGKLHGSAYERVADCVLDLRAWLKLLRERGNERIALVGHSLGALKGIVALAGKEFPEITRLIAVSPPWLSYERFSAGRKKELFLATLEEAQALVDSGRGETLMEVLYPLPYVVTAAGYVDKYGQEERYNVSDLIGGVKVPTLVTFGTEELGAGGPFHGLPEEISRLAAEGTTHAEVRVIEGANHQYLDRHEALAEAVLGWLRANA
jgi:pimeloyl-ACP methyl ester carboxylesterase